MLETLKLLEPNPFGQIYSTCEVYKTNQNPFGEKNSLKFNFPKYVILIYHIKNPVE